ncbi:MULTISPECIES: MerR family transcriptional regulator [unclassified Streptomyces]|uniref:MerR family transcriptional regulator n=1 Tax=unclassified Streptomyces TaxID=2593676 RepID=UPI0037F46BC6
MTTLRISQLAARTGVPTTTLRFYETAGLLPAERTASGYRIYGEDAVDRLAFIDAAKHLGLPLEEVAELLAVWESGACAEVKADLRPRVAGQITNAEQRITELTAFTASLHRALKHLDALPDRTVPCDPACGFLAPAASSRTTVPVTLSPRRTAAESEAERWRTASVTCSLSPDDIGERTVQWQQLVDGAVRQTIPDGLRLTLPATRAGDIATLASSEQQCCPFFNFRLHLDGPVLHLEVRAPADRAALLADLFGSAA